jgi:hypothetical protein
MHWQRNFVTVILSPQFKNLGAFCAKPPGADTLPVGAKVVS